MVVGDGDRLVGDVAAAGAEGADEGRLARPAWAHQGDHGARGRVLDARGVQHDEPARLHVDRRPRDRLGQHLQEVGQAAVLDKPVGKVVGGGTCVVMDGVDHGVWRGSCSGAAHRCHTRWISARAAYALSPVTCTSTMAPSASSRTTCGLGHTGGIVTIAP